MAVEASESGGAGAGDELLSRAEREVRKEREIGGEFEHIACRDGDDNDGSGTDGSFVMVVSGGDSDSSEKEIDLDVGGRAGDPPASADSGSSTFVVDDGDDGEGVRKEEMEKGDLFLRANEEKADEFGGGEDDEGAEKIKVEEEKVQAAEDMSVVAEEAIIESTRTDHEQKEEGELVCEVSEDEEKQKQKEAVAIEVSKHEGQNQGEVEVVVIKDSNAEKDRVIENLSNAEENVVSRVSNYEEQNEVEVEVLVVVDSKEEKGAITEDLNNEEGAVIDVEEHVSKGIEASCDHNGAGIASEGLINGAASAQISSPYPVTGELEVQPVLEESEDVEPSATQTANNEIETVSVIEERKKAIDEKIGDVDSSFVGQKEADNASEIDGRREEAYDEIGKDIVFSVPEPTKGEEHSVSDMEDGRNANDEEIEDVECSVTEPAIKVVDSNSEIEVSKDTDDERSKDVETSVTNHVEEVGSASDVGVGKTAHHDPSNCDDRENERRLAIQADKNQQIETSAIVSDDVEGDLNSSVEETEQHNIDRSLSKCEIEENGQKSSVELIVEPVKESTDSASIVEEYQVAEDSSIDRETVKEVASLVSRAEDRHVEALAIASNVDNVEELGSTSVADENQSANPTEDMGLGSEEEEQKDVVASFIDSSPEPIQEHMSTSEVEENLDADASSIALKPKLVMEVAGSNSEAEVNQDAGALITKGSGEKTELQSASELADVDKQPVEDLEVTEDQHKYLKSDEELITEPGNEKRLLSSATDLEERAGIHPDKGLGELEEQQKNLKLENKHDDVQNQLQQEIAAPSPSGGDGEKAEKHVKKYYIIKVPRFTRRLVDDERQALIDKAQLQVDQKTQSRDSIMSELKYMRKALLDCYRKRDYAIEEEKKAKALLNAKRQEMDSLQSVISKGKSATSFLDIISQIHTLEHKIQHETISLKEEKKYLHELNQLKHERELHIFNKCSQQEIDEAHKLKETAESSLRPLKKEFDLLKSVHSKADEYAKAASRSYIDMFNKIKEHEQKWKTASELRQIAYKNFDVLKSNKMEHYRKYMDDRQFAKSCASSRDIEALERHCAVQVERILHLWNEDEDFRRHYVESNVSSTVRRFGTLDGRTLGLNEEPVVLPSHVPPPSTTRNLAAPVIVREEQMLHAQGISNSPQPTKKVVRSKLSTKSTPTESVPVVVPLKEEIVEAEVEKKLTKEEEEQARLAEQHARKEQELRNEREAAEFKDKLKMEQKAKAKEAEERKRRKAEKAQARAEYRSQKEAELREQKRTKKEKKKEGISETTVSMEGESAFVTETLPHETAQEPESNAERTSKKSTRQPATALNKYSSRVQPVPLPLRNKGKRKTSVWIWPLCAVAAVGGLFFAGNYISFSNISLLDFGF